MKGYGKIVRIRHENGLVSGYVHLHKIFVKKGQPVKQKQVIGLVGKTGKVTGPHLDFQLLKNGKFIDPQDPRLKMARGDGKRVASPLKRRFQSVVGERLGCFATGPQGAEGERFANLR
jgi:murein DD-endopeptidase MepM/ murein hydrolase activator NlpD